jgi:chromosome segregation ATPase
MFNQNVQDALKKFQHTKNKENEKTQKDINELSEDFSTYQSKAKDIILKKEMYELKIKKQNIKEELNKDMENLREKNQTEILEIKSTFNQMTNTVKGHSSRLKQVEDRISDFEDEIEIKEKILVRQLKAVKCICQNSAILAKGQT